MDDIHPSNLNRQILYTASDLGRSKAAAAGGALGRFNPGLRVESLSLRLDGGNAASLIDNCDLVLDALDDWPSRFNLADAALKLGRPLIHAAVRGFSGHLLSIIPGLSPCLRCTFESPAEDPEPPVLGASCGVVGCLQALEAVKFQAGLEISSTDDLLIWDGHAMRLDKIKRRIRPDCGCRRVGERP
jgi:adenylyltransferase/sulfurtransferase